MGLLTRTITGSMPSISQGALFFSPRPENKNSAVPRYIAVSTTYIYGVHPGPLKEFYKPLRFRKPIATIGHSIFIYRVE